MSMGALPSTRRTQATPQPSLLKALLAITASWESVFPQSRTFLRGLRQAFGSLLCAGRGTISRILWACGREQEPFAAEYHLFSRSPWAEQSLFDAIWRGALPLCPDEIVGVALDDTRLPKTGRCIKQAFYQRDPLSPPFHVNLMLGLRFLQASLLVPAHPEVPEAGARALPVRFQEVSRLKKPGRKATEEEMARWKAAQKHFNLSTQAVGMMRELRQRLDAAGGADKKLIIAGDGSFCNKACFGAVIERTELLVRARKDSRLCLRGDAGGRSFYAKEKFTPESVRTGEAVPYVKGEFNYGGKVREVRYKEIVGVYWQGGAKRRQLRLIVLAPTPYRRRGRTFYRAAAYLLTSDLTTPAAKLIQIYLDRWQIEVNHREEKDTLGVGQAQCHSEVSVPRQPVLAVAAYSALLLAGLHAFGAGRTEAYAALPRWRRKARRPSCLDLVNRLREEYPHHYPLLPFKVGKPSLAQIARAAA
jgi:hypothetical protein